MNLKQYGAKSVGVDITEEVLQMVIFQKCSRPHAEFDIKECFTAQSLQD